MRRALMKARWLWLLAPLVAASCKDDSPPAPPDDSLTACVDSPSALPRPPSGQLPCELLPPGFSR
jgi:hypothetical protein